MLAALIIIVACLFFLGLGLLLSTNIVFVLIFGGIGLLLGALVGVLVLRGRVAQNEHWSIFVGPLVSGLLFVMLCGALNLIVRDSIGVWFGGLRMYSVALLLGTAPGLVIGWLLGQSMRGLSVTRRTSTGARQPGTYTVFPTVPLAPPDPPSGAIRWPPTPAPVAGLLECVLAERDTLERYGHVQITDLRDGSVCAVVTRQGDNTTIYMVCTSAYPQQPPSVTVERSGQALNVGKGVLFPWNSACRLEQIVLDLMARV